VLDADKRALRSACVADPDHWPRHHHLEGTTVIVAAAGGGAPYARPSGGPTRRHAIHEAAYSHPSITSRQLASSRAVKI